MNDELIDLAQSTQRRHAELIEQASRYTSTEARVEVRNSLDALQQEFTQRALLLTGVEAPYLWLAENPEHAVAIAVRKDIADTEQRLSMLANGQAFQKLIRSDMGTGVKLNLGGTGTGLALGLGAAGIGLILIALFFMAGRR